MPDVAEVHAQVPERAQRADARRNRERVLEAARSCMAREGIDAQVDEIARAAGVGIGTVYRHFPTKDDLIEALAMERFERLAELARAALANEDAWDAFEELMRVSAHIQSDDRALSEVLTSRPETMGRAADSVDMLGLVAEIMERAKRAGALREDADPRDVPMLMCALAGTYRNPYSNPDRYVQIMLDGLRTGGWERSGLPPVGNG